MRSELSLHLLIGVLAVTASVSVPGCGNTSTIPTDTTDTTDTTDDTTTTGSKSYKSTGGTSDLSVATSETGAAVITSLDPGAFAQSSDSADGSTDVAQTDPGSGDPPPGDGSAPPPDDGSAPPPDDGAAPPPDDGSTPPPDDGTQPPPDDGTQPPPDDGTQPPPDDGTQPPPDDGTQPPPEDPYYDPYVDAYIDDIYGEPIDDGLLDFFGDVDLEQIPPEFFADDAFTNFFVDANGEPVKFEEIDFDLLLNEVPLDMLYPDLPPQFQPDAFGEFLFGELPPPPEGFAAFPPPPDFLEEYQEFAFDFSGIGGPDDMPPPDGFPVEFYEFAQFMGQFEDLLIGGEFLLTDPKEEGHEDPHGLGYLPYEEVMDLMPEGFLPPEDALLLFEAFGLNHPLIAEGGSVNPELELAFNDHPPVPEGYEGFDFDGDCPQFDDLFSVYDQENIGDTMRGQVVATFGQSYEDGSSMHCSETTVLEAVQGEATPLIDLGDGLFETQWTVNVRQLTSASFAYGDPADPTGDANFDLAKEILATMTWTVVMLEVDIDGDGVPDEVKVSGSNAVDVLSEIVTGDIPEGVPDLPPPPDLILNMDFEGVLNLDLPTEVVDDLQPDAGQ